MVPLRMVLGPKHIRLKYLTTKWTQYTT